MDAPGSTEVVYVSFSLWSEFQKTQHVTYHSFTSLIIVKMLFLQGTRFQVTAYDELHWYSVQQSYAITI